VRLAAFLPRLGHGEDLSCLLPKKVEKRARGGEGGRGVHACRVQPVLEVEREAHGGALAALCARGSPRATRSKGGNGLQPRRHRFCLLGQGRVRLTASHATTVSNVFEDRRLVRVVNTLTPRH